MCGEKSWFVFCFTFGFGCGYWLIVHFLRLQVEEVCVATSIDKCEGENISIREFNVVHQSCNSAFLRSSIEEYDGTLGSLEILLASCMAASVSVLNFGISTLKGSPPCKTHWRKKMFTALDISMPSSLNSSFASF